MARKFGFLFLGVCLVMGILGFIGCDTGGDEDETVPRFGPAVSGAEFSGTWGSEAGDSLKIDTSANTFSYSGADPDWGMDYAGEIVGDVLADKDLLKAKWGYITFKVTTAGAYGPTVGKYFVIHWKELTPTTVMEAGAYKADGQNSGMDTADAAATEYTVENDYFDMFGAYSKQP
jgi:hypothetical protein